MTTTTTWRELLALDGPLVDQSDAFRKGCHRLDATNVRILLSGMARREGCSDEAVQILKALASMYDYAHWSYRKDADNALAAFREAGRLYRDLGQFADLSRLHYTVMALADGKIATDLYRFAAELINDELEPEHAAALLGRITAVRRTPLNWLLHKIVRATVLQYKIWRYDLGWARRRPRPRKTTLPA